MFLPPKPYKGNQVLKWAQKIHDYIQEITPRSSNRIKVNRTPVGTTFSEKPDFYSDPFHFEVISDPNYTSGGSERKLAIRGGYFTRCAWELSELEITAPAGASPSFAAAGGVLLDDLAISDGTIANGVQWIVYLTLWNDSIGDWNSINPTHLVAKVAAGTIVSPPPRPTDPATDNVQNWTKILAVVTNIDGKLTFDQEWRGGNIKDFELIPDGNPMYTGSTPRIESLDYADSSSNDTINGHLQDRDAHEILIDGDVVVTKYDNDIALSYFLFDSTGVTKKYYARVDTHAAGSWTSPWGKSLEIGAVGPEGGTVIQWYGFDDLTSQEDDDAKGAYVDVDANGDHFVKYAWPVTFESRPRNDFDGSADDTEVLVALADPGTSGLSSYATIEFVDRQFTVSQATLDIGAEQAADTFNIYLQLINSSDITWDEWIHHDETDPTLGTDPHAAQDWEENPDQDDRYWPAFGAAQRGGGTYGVDSKSFHTTGDMRANDIYVQDDATNHWGDDELRVKTTLVYIEADAGTLEIETSGANNIIIDSGAALEIDTVGNIDILAGGDFDMVAATVDITAGNQDINLYATTSILLDTTTYGGDDILVAAQRDFVVTTIDDIVLDSGDDITIDSAGDTTLVSAGIINLDPTGDLQISGNAGQTLVDGSNVFEKGVFVNDASWAVYSARVIPAGGGAPVDINIMGRLL